MRVVEKRQLLSAEEINRTLQRLAHEIVEKSGGAKDLALVGIRRRGVPLAARMAEQMLERGVYVVGFSYPVVPQGKARIRVQVSAAHTRDDLDFTVEAFAAVRDETCT